MKALEILNQIHSELSKNNAAGMSKTIELKQKEKNEQRTY